MVSNKHQQHVLRTNGLFREYNPADVIRYQFLRSKSLDLKPKGISERLYALLTDVYYYLYDDHVIERNTLSVWQKLFSNPCFQQQDSINSSEHDLLLSNTTEANIQQQDENVVR